MLLNKGAREFVNHPRGVTILPGNERIVSSLYVWIEEDFGDSEKDVIKHLNSFANADLRAVLETINEIDDHSFDWSLNDLK